jgi:hypothetical protein
MATITLSVPDELKSMMEKEDWVNWSSVARHAFAEQLKDIKELHIIRKARRISEIAEGDNREVKPEVAKEVVKELEALSKKVKHSKKKGITLKELDKLLGLK